VIRDLHKQVREHSFLIQYRNLTILFQKSNRDSHVDYNDDCPGRFHIHGTAFPVADHANTQDRDSIAYVRPHHIDLAHYVAGSAGVVAKLNRGHAIGPLTQWELQHPDHAEILK